MEDVNNIKLDLATIRKILNKEIKLFKLSPKEFNLIILSAVAITGVVVILNVIVYFLTGSNFLLKLIAPLILIGEIILFTIIKKINKKYGDDAFFIFMNNIFSSLLYGDLKESLNKFKKKSYPRINDYKIIK
jgi:hypothetical protein